VVIHEFAHKLDMHDGHANGCPLAPGVHGPYQRQRRPPGLGAVWGDAYERFRDLVIRHERFGQPAPWLDAYGAEAPAEFLPWPVKATGWTANAWPELPTVVHALDAFFGRLAR
jgi:Mlc titration factor MtfA (ptsG expression regulator)